MSLSKPTAFDKLRPRLPRNIEKILFESCRNSQNIMNICGIYSFNQGREVIEREFATEFVQIKQIIASVAAEHFRMKVRPRETMLGQTTLRNGN